jgi:hypothetical protein
MGHSSFLQTNQMIGGYDIDVNQAPLSQLGYEGKLLSGVDEGGTTLTRRPRSRDLIYTACRIMGLSPTDFFIPGGPIELDGVRQS